MEKCKCKEPEYLFKEYKFLQQKTGRSRATYPAFKATCKTCGKLIGWYKEKP